MASWFLVSEPQPLATASNAEVQKATGEAPPAEFDRATGGTATAEPTARPRPSGGGDSLDQQAREMERMRLLAEKEQEATAVEPPTVESPTPVAAANPAAANRPAKSVAAPVEPARETSTYVLPIGIGLIAAIAAFIAANRLLSADI